MRRILVTALLCNLLLVVAAQERVEDKRFGFSMEKPEEWHTVTQEVTASILEKFNFSKEEMERLLKSHNNSIRIGSFMKYKPQTHAGIIPTINILVRKNPVPASNFDDFFDMMEASIKQMKSLFTNFVIQKGPDTVTLSNKKVFFAIVTYTMESGGKKYDIRTRTYSIPGDGYFIQLSMIDAPKSEDCTALYDKLQQSVSLN